MHTPPVLGDEHVVARIETETTLRIVEAGLDAEEHAFFENAVVAILLASARAYKVRRRFPTVLREPAVRSRRVV